MKDVTKQNPNTPDEGKYLNEIINNQANAESTRTTIEQVWEDERKIFIGDQWSTSFAYRGADARKRRPNSVDNFVMPAIMNIHAGLTATVPESAIEPREEGDTEIAEKVGPVVEFIKYKNKFPHMWKKLVMRGLQYGPIIGAVLWDNTWTGGSGPNRWVGDVRLLNVKRKEFFPDPAITDLEERLQDCSFIHRKMRKKMSYFKDRWGEKGALVIPDNDTQDDEGMDANQATLYEAWEKGDPKFISDEWKQYFLAKAEEAQAGNMTSSIPVYPDPYKAEKYRKMAKGELEGVHVAYTSKDVFLEYIPYIYDDGLYPFIYKVMYEDENSPWGFGEIRNLKIPQVLHNKADEIEIEGMSVEGLGGARYNRGAISSKQLENIKAYNGKGGMYFEVNDISGIEDRTGVKTPATISQYKEQKQRMIETISQNTPIQQGMKPGGVTAYSAIAELGERADTRNKGKAETLEDFLTEKDQMIVSRIAQFYTEERQYRVTGSDGKPVHGKFSNQEMVRYWEREPSGTDEKGNETSAKMEAYIPEFDVKVKVIDERPTSRNYYIELAMQLFEKQAIDLETLWFVIEEGKFPPKEEILERLNSGQGPFSQYSPEMQNMLLEMMQSDPQSVLMIVQNQLPEEEIMAMMQGQQMGGL